MNGVFFKSLSVIKNKYVSTNSIRHLNHRYSSCIQVRNYPMMDQDLIAEIAKVN